MCEKVKLIKNSWVVNRYQTIKRTVLNKMGKEENYWLFFERMSIRKFWRYALNWV